MATSPIKLKEHSKITLQYFVPMLCVSSLQVYQLRKSSCADCASAACIHSELS